MLDEQAQLLDLDKTDWLEFYIVLVRESDREKPPALTPRLFMLREGDRLAVGRKITGHFTADPIQPDDSVVFLSTGTGEAPHNYLSWQLLRRAIAAISCRPAAFVSNATWAISTSRRSSWSNIPITRISH